MDEDAKSHPGHQALLRQLRERENDEPLIRAHSGPDGESRPVALRRQLMPG